MKANTLFLTLQCAALAASAPLSSPPPANTPTRPHWALKLPRISTETDFTPTLVHNRPTTPPRRPQSAEYLTSFTHGRPKSNSEVATDGTRGPNMDDVLTVTGADLAVLVVAVPESSRLDTPVHLARLSRERDDVTVLVLSMVFFLVVLAVEGWGVVCRSVRRAAYGRGEIWLEEEEREGGACGGKLSVRCEDEGGEVVEEREKVGF